MEDKKSRASLLSNDVQDRLWPQVLLKEALHRRLLGLQLLQHHLPPPSPPPCLGFLFTPSVESDCSVLTSFLEVDCSFFSPWNWSPNSPQDRDDAARYHRMIFQPDSFFSVDQELYTWKSGKEVGI